MDRATLIVTKGLSFFARTEYVMWICNVWRKQWKCAQSNRDFT